MTQWSDERLNQAGREIAEGFQQLNRRVQQLEGRPEEDAFKQQWQEGREFARRKGYTGKSLEDLEDYMQREGIPRHKHAIADGVVPASSGFGFFETEDLQLLMSGDDEGFLRRSIPKALRNARYGDQ